MISCMISYLPVSCATMILKNSYDIIHDIMFFYDIIYDIMKHTHITRFLCYKTYDIAMISYQYHIISYMISRTYDIIAL